jgi:hypothetical protein
MKEAAQSGNSGEAASFGRFLGRVIMLDMSTFITQAAESVEQLARAHSAYSPRRIIQTDMVEY